MDYAKKRCIGYECLRNFFCEDGVGGLSGLNIGGGRCESSIQNMPSPPRPRGRGEGESSRKRGGDEYSIKEIMIPNGGRGRSGR